LTPYYREDPENIVALIKKNRGKIVALGEIGFEHYIHRAALVVTQGI
jgi:predicted urease superfamily metal-dependent hydrolase